MKATVSTTKKAQYVTGETIMTRFYRNPAKKQVDIMFSALNYMQRYNGRSKMLCIAMAMGYDNDEGDNVSYYKRS